MLSYILAFFLGLSISFGPLAFLSSPLATLSSIFVSYAQIFSEFMIKNIANIPESSKLLYYLVPVISVSLPGFVSLIIVVMIDAVNSVKKFISLVGTIVGFGSFFFLPWTQATVIFIASIILALLINFIGGPLLIIPMVALATTSGVNIAKSVFTGSNPYIDQAVSVFQKAQPTADPLIWKYALAFAAIAPLLGVIGIVFNYSNKSKSK